MKSKTPFDKAQVIERSLRCFEFGIVGLLPVIGLPFAMVALGAFAQVKRHRTSVWNPAERYLRIGSSCAAAGLGLTLLIVSAIAIQMWFAPASLQHFYTE
jgi:hypothetical protein